MKEYRRRIDFQIDQHRHYQNMAQSILRILLSMIGLIITATSLGLSNIRPGEIYSLLEEDKLNLLSQRIAENSALSPTQSDFIVIVLGVILLFFVYKTVENLFIRAPVAQLKVLAPSAFDKSSKHQVMEPSYEGSTNEFELYEVAEHNQTILERSKIDLNESFVAIKKGVKYFSGAVFLVLPPFIFPNPLLAFVAFAVLIIISIFLVLEKYSYSDIERNLFLDPILDISTAFLFITTMAVIISGHASLSLYIRRMVLIILLLGIIIPPIYGFLLPTEKFISIGNRQFFLFTILFLLFAVSQFIAAGQDQAAVHSDLSFSLLTATTVASLLLAGGHFPRQTILFILRLIKKYAPQWMKTWLAIKYRSLSNLTPLPGFNEVRELIQDPSSTSHIEESDPKSGAK